MYPLSFFLLAAATRDRLSKYYNTKLIQRREERVGKNLSANVKNNLNENSVVSSLNRSIPFID